MVSTTKSRHLLAVYKLRQPETGIIIIVWRQYVYRQSLLAEPDHNKRYPVPGSPDETVEHVLRIARPLATFCRLVITIIQFRFLDSPNDNKDYCDSCGSLNLHQNSCCLTYFGDDIRCFTNANQSISAPRK